MIQFTEKFQERMQQMLGDEEYAEFLKSYDLPFHNGLRINTWKTKPQELLQRMGVDLKQVPWNETGFYLENKKQYEYIGITSGLPSSLFRLLNIFPDAVDTTPRLLGTSIFKTSLLSGRSLLYSGGQRHAAGKACECTAWGEDSGYVCGTGRQKYGHRCSLKG